MPANPLNTDDFGGELYNLAMSEGARPLLERVTEFIANEVEPITEEEGNRQRFALGDGNRVARDAIGPLGGFVALPLTVHERLF